MIVATIVSGKGDLADVAFLVAVILGLLAALASSPNPTKIAASAGACLGWLALTFAALGLLLL